ncbi:4-hydroxy-tetrahydrodipicolinate synthase [Halorhodospira halochloris]|uniref:4-hydroxy-tetrahydrodipicolinate synthase n=1 Tax=Halorhodospira halochloris TaxID=1052 RepID=A0A110B1B2_HALHR|nr:4-hydroxy-tetrahydrodipicolinate synthase [Halorhodospira halochloris]MBK1652271.1 4-hydroxy-tetrahydrodipicolinate synthase [Halorhodospira halochloris]BAU56935.1 4-hydroxy-tetrahydrodipicolinate synthase [Halorhodospira halochloris]
MFRGSMVAMVTPMQAQDGIRDAVDDQALRRLVDYHVDNGTDAIVAVGTTGESATLDYQEHENVIRIVVEAAAGRIPVIGGTGANSTWEAIELTRSAQESGCDGALLVVPYYNKPTQQGLYDHFKAVADAVPIPQILYNVPGRTGCDMLPQTVARLADIDNIVGLKEAQGTVERAREVVELCGDRLDVFSGDDFNALGIMRAGGKGVISVSANIAPRQMHELCEAALSGDDERAEQINDKLSDLHQAMFSESNPIPVKWAVEHLGLAGAGMRLPMTRLTADNQQRVLRAMEQAGLL